jgi:predicted nucleotidyltransferase
MERAIDRCARRSGEPPESTLQRLRQGDPEAHSSFRYALAKELGQYLGGLGASFQAVYVYGSSMGNAASPCSDIDLLAVVERRRDEVTRLLSRIDLALAACYRELLHGAPAPASLLDFHIMDASEERERRGYGALLTGLGTCPACLWRSPRETTGAFL